jgi:hypothetical protein
VPDLFIPYPVEIKLKVAPDELVTRKHEEKIGERRTKISKSSFT